MIYLIGTRHDLQYTGAKGRGDTKEDEQSREDFKTFLRNNARILKPTLLGEEMLESVLKARNAQSSVKFIANELNIEHRFCDAELEVRKSLGIPTEGSEHFPPEEKRTNFRVLENYWLEQIKDMAGSTIIFVCGAEHIKSFDALLKLNGIKTSIIERDFRGTFREPLECNCS